MKKIILILITCILMATAVAAAGQQQGNQGATNPEVEPAQVNAEQMIKKMQEPMEVQTQTQQQNKGQETKVQAQTATQAKAGNYQTEKGQSMQIREQGQNKMQLSSGGVSANTGMKMTQEKVQDKTRLKVQLSNGRNAEVKVMPNTVSEKAIERLQLKVCSAENNCQIELKEVGQGEQTRAAYEVHAEKEAKLFGLFKTKMQVQAQVDAENGEVIQSKKPWWAFLASE